MTTGLARRSAPDLRGSLDSIEPDGRVFGWCWSPDEPALRRRVTIHVDGEVSGSTTADVLRLDLLDAGIGDGGHGFVAEIPARLRQPGHEAIIRLDDTASRQEVGGTMRITWPAMADASPEKLAGNLDLVTRDGFVTGWCWDPADPDRRLVVDVALDDEIVGRVEAAEARADLRDAGVGDGRYGFHFMLPYEALAERGTVLVRVTENGSGRPLGDGLLTRIGRRAEADRRLQELERQVMLMQGRLEVALRALDPDAEARAAKRLFASMAALFQDLADSQPSQLRQADQLMGGREPPAGPAFVGHALVVDAELPVPSRDAGSVAAMEQMLSLRRLGWRVTFATPPVAAAPAAVDRQRLEQAGIEVADMRDAGVVDLLRDIGGDLSLVHLYRHRIATLLLPRVREFAPDAKILFSPADLHFLREARQAELAGTGSGGAATRNAELGCIRAADATLLMSDHEMTLLADEVDPAKLHLLRWIDRPSGDVPDFSSRENLLFIGNFRHAPNADAVLWYANEVLPILRSLRPGLVLHVVGLSPPDAVRRLDGEAIRVHGWIEDLAPLLMHVRVGLAPLRYGAGFKGKVATSLAAGLPVVGTPIAFEGTGLTDGDGIVVAATAAAFAQAVATAHDDAAAWRSLSQRGRERVGTLYSPQAADKILRDLLAGLNLPASKQPRSES